MAKTLRSQNKCNDCRYTWYPRGKNISRVCPKCGSENVAVVIDWAPIPILAVAGIALYLIFFNGKVDNHTSTIERALDPTHHESPITNDVFARPQAEPGVKQSPLLVEAKEKDIETSRRPAPSESEPAAEEILSSSFVASPMPAIASAPSSPQADLAIKVEGFERIYNDEEISALEEQKQYHGDDSIVRSRLGIPSRETRKLIR
jgi:hypothetical protein